MYGGAWGCGADFLKRDTEMNGNSSLILDNFGSWNLELEESVAVCTLGWLCIHYQTEYLLHDSVS